MAGSLIAAQIGQQLACLVVVLKQSFPHINNVSVVGDAGSNLLLLALFDALHQLAQIVLDLENPALAVSLEERFFADLKHQDVKLRISDTYRKEHLSHSPLRQLSRIQPSIRLLLGLR